MKPSVEQPRINWEESLLEGTAGMYRIGKNGGLQVQKGTSMKYAFASENPIFAFDLDGTITTQETLPILARELDLMNEMEQLTRLTLEGKIDFEASFRMRYHLLREIPLQKIRQIMEDVHMDERIAGFIREHALL